MNEANFFRGINILYYRNMKGVVDMNFISKDCAVFLFNTVLGVFIYLGSIIRGLYKLWQLNPEDTHAGLKYLNAIMDEVYRMMWTNASDVREDVSEDGRCSVLETIVMLLGCGMIWPLVTALVVQATENVCSTIKDGTRHP